MVTGITVEHAREHAHGESSGHADTLLSAAPALRQARYPFREGRMLRWSLIFLIVALVAAALGFGGIAAAAAGIAKVLFYIFLVLFLITLIAGLAIGRRITS
jgi:uncharacterized membrane protein YtjA (UPF0391 family)